MTANVKDLRLLNDDVLLRHRPTKTDSIIHIEDSEDESTAFRYEVVRVSPRVKHVKEGEVVVVPWRYCTPPFEAQRGEETINVVITDEKEILGVVDYE